MEGKIIEQPAGYFNNLEEFAKEDNAEILKKLTSQKRSIQSLRNI